MSSCCLTFHSHSSADMMEINVSVNGGLAEIQTALLDGTFERLIKKLVALVSS